MIGDVVYCKNGCGRGVDPKVWPNLVKADGTFECGLDCSCGARLPCPRIHVGTFRPEDADLLRSLISFAPDDVFTGEQKQRLWAVAAEIGSITQELTQDDNRPTDRRGR